MGVMIEALARSIGFTISIATGGNPKGIDEMATVASNYILEEAAHKQPFAILMHAMRAEKARRETKL
mgnify:CR=1 FL=1